MVRKIINETKKPISIFDIFQRVPWCKVWTYDDLEQKTLNDLLPASIILYTPKKCHVGHFCAIFLNSEGVNFYDPLGQKPDAICDTIPFLTKMLIQNKYNIIYNPKPLQKITTSTCGKWCIIRIINMRINCGTWENMWKGVKNRDIIICELYNELQLHNITKVIE